MSFEIKYAPKALSDVIVTDPKVRNMLQLYTHGGCQKPLLLHGPFGSGKTTIANLLPRAIEGIPEEEEEELEVTKLKASEFQTVSDLKNTFILSTNMYLNLLEQSRFYIITNELRLSANAGIAFRDILDNICKDTQIIITTNDPSQIDAGVVDRCNKLYVPRITADEWLPKALEIARKEGVSTDEQAILDFLKAQLDYDSSVRKMMSEFELFIFAAQNKQHLF
jgi:DNA polymerase III delta prime subunit